MKIDDSIYLEIKSEIDSIKEFINISSIEVIFFRVYSYIFNSRVLGSFTNTYLSNLMVRYLNEIMDEVK